MRIFFLALCLAAVAVADARAQSSDVQGWWRAELEHGGQRTDFYLHLDIDGEGNARARFSAPVVRMQEVYAGPYRVQEDVLAMPGLGWSLTMRDDALDGVLPPGLVAFYQIQAHFVRADAPTAPAPIAPSETAPAPVWTADVGVEVWAGLVHDSRRNAVYVAGDDGRVTSFAARTGARQWTADLGSPIRATPTLHGGRLYVASDAALTALDPRTGARIWQAPFGAQKGERLPLTDPNSNWDHYSASAVVVENLVAVASRDGCIYALDPASGAQRWRTCTDSIVTSTPAITRDAVFFSGFDGNAYALSRATGAELWRYNTNAPAPRDVVVSNGEVLVGSRSYDLLALDVGTGEPRWTRYWWFSWIDSPPALSRGVAYIGASDALAVQAFDPRDGRPIWAAPVPGWNWARPGIGAQTIYASVAGGPYIDRRAGGFAAIDRRTGALRWYLEAPRPTQSRVYGFAAGPAVAGRMVFTADLDGRVYAFRD